MILFKKAVELRKYLEKQETKGKSIGFVPTMGALHEGHRSLAKTCKEQNDLCVSSIFINPTQFNDPKDFDKYPVTIEKDILLLEKTGCDLLFLPTVTEMYPEGIKEMPHYDIGFLETILEGKFRPGHFQGVCTIVHRLIDSVKPHKLYLGQKDYQQCMVIQRLLELIGAENRIELIICPTLRENDGLAMSSRNVRLGKTERERAPFIFEMLTYIKSRTGASDPSTLKADVIKQMEAKGFQVEYVEIANAKTLKPILDWNESTKLVALIAAFNNDVRLIDNILINQ